MKAVLDASALLAYLNLDVRVIKLNLKVSLRIGNCITNQIVEDEVFVPCFNL
ncbi:hypothetical protein QUB00_30915 [Microcoleus sp. F8_C2]